MNDASDSVAINLSAIIVTLVDGNPAILRLAGSDDVVADVLPSGIFSPSAHVTLEAGLRQLLREQTGSRVGKTEQLFAEMGKDNSILTIGYLALTSHSGEQNTMLGKSGARWKSWYAFLPWEDWRIGRPHLLDAVIIPALRNWANTEGAYAISGQQENSASRINTAFALDGKAWQARRVVERFDLMCEAGLLAESMHGKRPVDRQIHAPLGIAMAQGQRRMLAVAIDRLREKFQHVPVITELMAQEFTLTDLQHCGEGIMGQALHKQNFRRQVDNLKLVEKTGRNLKVTGGRPAALYRFCVENNFA